MWLSQLRNLIRSPRRTRPPAPKPYRRRLLLEQLEDRMLPSSYTAATVSDLIADINAANTAGDSNTIVLAANTTFDLTVVNNTTDGANGLPVIAANDNLTISGQGGDIIQRDNAARAFRLFDVAAGASLTLQNLTLQGGLAFGVGVSADGGAIYNPGRLDLNGVTVQGNIAQGQDGTGASATGGGIYSAGALTLAGGTLIQKNQAVGGQGAPGNDGSMVSLPSSGGPGGDGLGGGLYVAGGTTNLTNVTLYANTARGGQGGPGAAKTTANCDCSTRFAYTVSATDGGAGGNGLGGGLYVAGGTATLSGDTVSSNTAQGGAGGKGGSGGGHDGSPGLGEGGGIYLADGATVMLDAFTLANTKHNKPDDIYGTYTQTT
jgi:hypothetical protein